MERRLQKVCARFLRISLIFIADVIISVIIDYHCTSHIVKLTLHTPHATKGRCLMIFIVFGSTHLSRRGYNNNEYYYDRRKSAAAMAYLATAAPTPLDHFRSGRRKGAGHKTSSRLPPLSLRPTPLLLSSYISETLGARLV